MNKKVFLLLLSMVVVIGLVFVGCKSGSDAADNTYTLTVTLGNGVTGTPVAGSTSYEGSETVSYNYSAQAGYGNLTVTLDGAPVASSGTVTMDGNHTLNVTADIDIRGQWTGQLYWNFDRYFIVTFSGGIVSGTATGNFDGITGTGNGEFTFGGGQLELVLRFNRSGIIDTLTCSGTLSDPNHLSGSFNFEAPGCGGATGNWNLARN